MADVFVTPTALRDLEDLIATRRLPTSTRARLKQALTPLAGFPLLGPELSGRWKGYRFLLGPWSWMLVVYVFDEKADRVSVVTIQDARSGRSGTSTRTSGR